MAESVLNREAEVNKGATARMQSFVGALAVADLVKTTLGPKGMDKILQSVSSRDGKVTITNDGATILKAIPIDNAAAKCLVNIAKIQDEEVGDGTTSVVVLTGELLREAEELMKMRIHPMTIVDGWRIATKTALAALEESAIDHSTNEELFKKDLLNIARTTLSSKLLTSEKDHFAHLAVESILKLRGSDINLELIQVIKVPGGSLHDSFVSEGFILNKKIGVGQPKKLVNAKILIANTSMDTDKIKIFGSNVKVDSLDKVAEIEEAEKNKMRKKCQKIIDHGINCFINRQLIYNFPEQIFADAGIMAIEHADFVGVERLAAVTGGEITSTFDHPELTVLGKADLIEEVMIGEQKMIKFSGVGGGKACSIILRGASSHILDEAERSLHDALCVLQQTCLEPRTTLGGGAAECLMAKAVDEMVPKTAGKQSLAVESFARALRQMPAIISDNAGYDSADLVAQLRNAHFEGNKKAGLDMKLGKVGDMEALGITEPFKLKRQVLLSAAEAAEMILRVDEIVKCAPRKRGGAGDGH